MKVAKIIAKTECCKHPRNYYLEVQHLIHFNYHYVHTRPWGKEKSSSKTYKMSKWSFDDAILVTD